MNWDDEALRRAFGDATNEAMARDDCPTPGRIWEACHGELSPDETAQIVDHLGVCPLCAEAWRLAREPQIQEPQIEEPFQDGQQTPARIPWAWIGGLALAAVIVLVALPVLLPSGENSAYREGFQPEEIQPLVADGAQLPREAFLLEWRGPEATWTVNIGTETLQPVDRAEGISATEYLVPEAKLKSYTAGTKLLWQVQAALQDGSKHESATFSVVIE